MIKIIFYKKNNLLFGFEANGHSGYAETGSDIVCSAVSSMTQMAVVGLSEVLNLKLNTKKDKNGYLLCKLSEKNTSEAITKAQDFLKTLLISLEDVEKDYKKFIKLEVKDEIH